MPSDLEAMIRVAARLPSGDPGVEHLWRRTRRRLMFRRGAAVAGALCVAAVVGSVVEPDLTPVVAPIAAAPPRAEVPLAVDTEPSGSGTWVVHGLGLTVDVPASWRSTDDPLVRSGSTGHVRLAVSAGAGPAAGMCRDELVRPGSPYGPGASVVLVTVDGQDGCRIDPAVGGSALAILPFPAAGDLGPLVGASHLFVHADAQHLDGLLDSLRFLRE